MNLFGIICSLLPFAQGKLSFPIYPLGKGDAEPLGHITAVDTTAGLELRPEINSNDIFRDGGERGFHVHEFADCADKNGVIGGAAGAHWDPDKTGTHQGPSGKGHKGDLPPLTFNKDGSTTSPVVASRLTELDVVDKALIIHEGGDNFSDTPPNGGGKARLACGFNPSKMNMREL